MKNIVLLSLIILFLACQNENSNEMAPAEPPEDHVSLNVKEVLANIKQVKIDSLQSINVDQNINCTGIIHIPPTEMISIHGKSEGIITMMKYLPGDFVRKGEVLYSIMNTKLVEKQRLFLESKAEWNAAVKVYERQKKLHDKEATSQKSLDEAIARKELLTAKYFGLKNELKLLGIQTEILESEQKFQSTVNIYAPEAGFVQTVNVNRGQMIHPEDKLMELAGNKHIHLELYVHSKDVLLLKRGQEVSFTLPNNGKNYSAIVEKLTPMVDPETGTLQVHCHIAEEDMKSVKAGMFANAEIQVDYRKIIGLKMDAVIKEGEDYYAYKVHNEKLEKVLLRNVQHIDDVIIFENDPTGKWVIEGAYYLEG